VSAADVEVAEVVGVFGIHGEVRLRLMNPSSDILDKARDVTLVHPNGERRTVRLETRSGAGHRLLGRIAGVADRDAATALRGTRVVVGRDQLPLPAAGEYYVHDLLGLDVRERSGRNLGKLREVVPGARDIWVVETDVGRAIVLATSENIVEVDLASGEVVIADGAWTVV